MNTETPMEVRLEQVCEAAELDEQWSYVREKSNQRWLWHAVDHATNTVLAYVFGRRKDDVFKELKALLEPFNISCYYTTPMTGVPMSATGILKHMKLVKQTHKKLNEKILILERGLNA